ncbi:MAG TPA: hypothetical protein VMW01_01525 [Williamwhitmania sp.]|nr:hypothetical protein [Williamwhitmania sp.]
MKNLFLGTLMLCSFSVLAADGPKTVAITTIYVNKTIQTESASSVLLSKIDAIGNNPAFKLDSVLAQFKRKFETEYAPSFPFKLLPEQEVITNEKYKEFKSCSADTNSAMMRLFKPLLPSGYKFMIRTSTLTNDKRRDEMIMLSDFPDVDGVMFISLDYTIVPKMAIGGLGVAGMRATARIYLVNKKGEKVFDKFITGMSSKSVGMVEGIPVMDLDKILPLCTNATEDLFKEMDSKLPKLLKKIDKNM